MRVAEIGELITEAEIAGDEMDKFLREYPGFVDHKDPLRFTRRALESYLGVLAWLGNTELRLEVEQFEA